MEELELSIMAHGVDPVGDLSPWLDPFMAQHGCRVRVRVLSWETAWADLVKVALYNVGPDVSEVGTNWVSNLVAMDGLRPFLPGEMKAIGATAFLSTAWHSGWVIGDKQPWAVPWLADTRVIYYRRDWLAQAGIDEQTAFASHDQLVHTLERLQASGIASPLVIPTRPTANTLHNLASWVWGAGGDFVDVPHKRTAFNQPAARAGILAYLGLHRFLSPQARHLSAGQSDLFYLDGQAAVTIGGPWLMTVNLGHPATEAVKSNSSVAPAPGVPFVGGSNLVIWKHTRRARLAFELVRYLTGPAAQSGYCLRAGMLPVRLETLNEPCVADSPYCHKMAEALKNGRAFPAFSAWGLIEDGLTTELAHCWDDALDHPQIDLDAVLEKRLAPLAARLDLTLSQTL